MKAAAIDLGTNAFRFLIRDLDEKNNYGYKSRYVVGLGKYLNDNSYLVLPKLYYETLDMIFSDINKNNVDKIHIVGTSVFREALNKEEIVDNFKARYNQNLNIISSKTEAELTSLGTNSLRVESASNKIIVDIGGGSTEIILTLDDKFVDYVSLDLGVIKLLKIFKETNIFSNDKIIDIKNYIKSILSKIDFYQYIKNDTQVIFNSGTPTTLAAISMNLIKYDPEKINGSRLSNKITHKIFEKLCNKTSKDRLEINGIEKGREEVIVYGVLILLEILEYFKIDHYFVSDLGVLEGIFEKYIEI